MKNLFFPFALPFAYRAVAKDEETDYLGQAVYERLQAVGIACGVDDCRPHRLRDTFAVRLLTKGVPLEDVSKLLGHAIDRGYGEILRAVGCVAEAAS